MNMESALLASRQAGGMKIQDADILTGIASDAFDLGDSFFVTDKLRHLVYLLAEQVAKLEKRVRELEQK